MQQRMIRRKPTRVLFVGCKAPALG